MEMTSYIADVSLTFTVVFELDEFLTEYSELEAAAEQAAWDYLSTGRTQDGTIDIDNVEVN